MVAKLAAEQTDYMQTTDLISTSYTGSHALQNCIIFVCIYIFAVFKKNPVNIVVH